MSVKEVIFYLFAVAAIVGCLYSVSLFYGSHSILRRPPTEIRDSSGASGFVVGIRDVIVMPGRGESQFARTIVCDTIIQFPDSTITKRSAR